MRDSLISEKGEEKHVQNIARLKVRQRQKSKVNCDREKWN